MENRKMNYLSYIYVKHKMEQRYLFVFICPYRKYLKPSADLFAMIPQTNQ